MTERRELMDGELDNVVGGVLDHTWSNETGSGTLWIVSRATPKKYSFTNHHVVDYITMRQNEGWSDYEILEDLIDKNQVKLLNE